MDYKLKIILGIKTNFLAFQRVIIRQNAAKEILLVSRAASGILVEIVIN